MYVYVINIVWGDVIDEAVLVYVLKIGEIRGVGLDVFEYEFVISVELCVME